MSFKGFLFLALVAILFSGAEDLVLPIEDHPKNISVKLF